MKSKQFHKSSHSSDKYEMERNSDVLTYVVHAASTFRVDLYYFVTQLYLHKITNGKKTALLRDG